MEEYSQECLQVFLEKQGQLFSEPVADSLEMAAEFLEDCLAVVVNSLEEVGEYFAEAGIDTEEMGLEDLAEIPEVFALPGGQYLIVEG